MGYTCICIDFMIIVIRCLKNCGTISSPLENLYLSAETECKNCSLEWSYKEKTESSFRQTLDIKVHGTPSNILIVKRKLLDYNKIYKFKVEGMFEELIYLHLAII